VVSDDDKPPGEGAADGANFDCSNCGSHYGPKTDNAIGFLRHFRIFLAACTTPTSKKAIAIILAMYESAKKGGVPVEVN